MLAQPAKGATERVMITSNATSFFMLSLLFLILLHGAYSFFSYNSLDFSKVFSPGIGVASFVLKKLESIT
jgi:hypothetical protein